MSTFLLVCFILVGAAVFAALYLRAKFKRMTLPALEKKPAIRRFYCRGDSPSDNGEPYWFLEGVKPLQKVLVPSKPRKHHRRSKVATYVGVSRRDPEMVVLLSSSGDHCRRHWTDILRVVS